MVLVSALLTLLLVLAGTFVRMTKFADAGSGADRTRRAAKLATESGMEYAAARLMDEPRSSSGKGEILKPENTRDDWTPRGLEPRGLSPAQVQNPSYARGEYWQDADASGFFSNDPYDDVNGNGRFDVRSGRLRGGAEFALRITAAGSLICVNSGEVNALLADHDLDGVLNRDDPDYSTGPTAVPANAHRDPLYPGNVHLKNLLDNLGAVLDLSIETEPPYWAGTPLMGPLETSPLGTLVIQNRPAGGYTSASQIEPFLDAADYGKVAPFLTTAGEIVPVPVATELTSCSAYSRQYWGKEIVQPSRLEFHARIDFNTAPLEILQASLRHIASSGSKSSVFGVITQAINQPFLRLGAREADLVAKELANRRPIHAWKRFLEILHTRCNPLFEDDPFTKGTDESQGDLALLKEDLVLAQVMPAGYFGDPHTWRQNSLEVARDGDPVDPALPRRIFKDLLTGPLIAHPYDKNGDFHADYVPFPTAQSITGLPSRVTTEYSLAGLPLEVWEIAAQGSVLPSGPTASGTCRAKGTLHVGGAPLLLSGQLQLEQPAASPAAPWYFPGGAARTEGPCLAKDGVQTWPLFNRDRYDATLLPYYGTTPDYKTCDGYPAATGGVRLASRQIPAGELALADFALPFNEGRPGEPGTWYNDTDWLDNFGDPLTGGGPNGHRSPDPGGGQDPNLFHLGAIFGPWGLRLSNYYDLFGSTPSVAFDWTDPAWAPLVPFTPAPVGTSHALAEATFTAWIPARAKSGLVNPDTHLTGKFEVSMVFAGTLDGSSVSYFSAKWEKGGTILAGQGASLTPCPSPWSIDPAFADLARAGWHHLAVTFPAPEEARIYIDGCFSRAVALPAIPDYPGPPDDPFEMKGHTVSLRAPFDDVRIFHRVLSDAEIGAEARREPYEKQGTGGTLPAYVSPEFIFDAERFPKGALLRGITWDGFIPAQTNGKISFEVTGTNDAGVDLPPEQLPSWSGTGPMSGYFAIDGCRKARIRVTIDATSPEPIPLGPGPTQVSALRDSPHIGEMVLRFAERPRWSGLSQR